jgi:hypothetical protein
MRYMTLWRPSRTANPPTPKLYEEMGAFIAETTKSGQLVLAGGWDPSGPCTTVKKSSGKLTVTDGPFTEAKELVGGFALLEVRSKEEALEIARRFVAIAGDGTSEIRELPTEPSR